MKKLILIASLMISLAGLSAFGQGYFAFSTGKSQVWDNFSSGSPQLATTVNVAFLWAANGDTPTVSILGASTPANMTVATATFSTSAAWSDILTDPNFALALNNTSGAVAVATSLSNGAVDYNGGSVFGVSGTSVGTTYTLFLIGWNGAYATPALASAAAATDGCVGWSETFTYTATAFTATPTSFATPAFGVVGMVPEPSAIALAGLGSLSLLLLRRRK